MTTKSQSTKAKTNPTINQPSEAPASLESAKPVKSTNTQSIIIAILATAIVCIAIIFAVLIGTGVIKFGGTADNTTNSNSNSQGSGNPSSTSNPDDTSSSSRIIENTYPRVTVDDSTLAKVQDLEFYLPDAFEAGGKNKDGAYTYNLVDDDGWAQVLVYVEKSSLTPAQYLAKISSYLDITDTDYQMNGTSWVQGENASSLAYATELDGTIYAVYYAVKLDSDNTARAMSMIPKTLYMARIYKH